MPKALLTLLALLSLSLSVVAKADSACPGNWRQIADSETWRRLLHYRRHFPWGEIKSEVDGGAFFLSPRGRYDPCAELQASAQAFADPSLRIGRLKLQPQCALPVRYAFLKSALKLSTPDVPCPELNLYLEKMHGESVTLVFSSAYPNSPPSMFGHTFLRINSGIRTPLLDYGLNYSALAAGDENGLAFAILGLTGGYPGQFGIVPYYMKVNEYNHSESRDLWEYDLTLSPAETRRLLEHTWELDQNARFGYYFIDENCSYRLLTLLEVARPDWTLSDFAIHVIPAETVKRVTAIPGAVSSIRYRPSLRKQMFHRFDMLEAPDRRQVFAVLDGRIPPAELQGIAPVEAALAWLRYRKQKHDLKLDPTDQKLFSELLILRSRLGASAGGPHDPAPELAAEVSLDGRAPAEAHLVSEESRPDLGHGPYRLGAFGGFAEQGAASAPFEEIGFKFAYHDLLNNDLGYSPFSQVDFPNIALRYSGLGHSLYIERLGILTVTSLFPMTAVEKQLSWKVDASYVSPKDFGCPDCHTAQMEAGVGATTALFTPKALLYGFVIAHTEMGSSLQGFYRYGSKLELAALANPVTPYKIRLAADAVTDLGQSYRQKLFSQLEWENSLSLGPGWEARASVDAIVPTDRQLSDGYAEVKAGLNRYF